MMKNQYMELKRRIDRLIVCCFFFITFIYAKRTFLLILDCEFQNDEKSAQIELRGAKSKLNNLQQEANDDMPAGLAGFEAAKEVRILFFCVVQLGLFFNFALLIPFSKTQEAEAEKEGLVAQATDVMTQRTELGEAQKALQHQLNEVKALIGEFEDKRAAFGVRLVLS